MGTSRSRLRSDQLTCISSLVTGMTRPSITVIKPISSFNLYIKTRQSGPPAATSPWRPLVASRPSALRLGRLFQVDLRGRHSLAVRQELTQEHARQRKVRRRSILEAGLGLFEIVRRAWRFKANRMAEVWCGKGRGRRLLLPHSTVEPPTRFCCL